MPSATPIKAREDDATTKKIKRIKKRKLRKGEQKKINLAYQ